MKQTKCTLTEMNSEQAVRVMNKENQSIMKGGDWGNGGGCCQYPPGGESSWSGGSWWSWIWSWFGNHNND